jgi:hypothetical protein
MQAHEKLISRAKRIACPTELEELISLALFVRVIPHAQKLQTEENGGSLAPYCLERKIK